MTRMEKKEGKIGAVTEDDERERGTREKEKEREALERERH
jgi:hypothetical protein